MKIKTIFLLFLSFLPLLYSCKNTEKTETNSEIAIRVTQVIPEQNNTQKTFSFIAKPFRTSELSFRVGGPIAQFDAYAGNYYKQGEVIAEIDDRDFLIRKERTQALYEQAKSEFERIKTLFEKNNISASSFEKAKADYTSAKTAFQTASNELNDTKLRAPFNGYIGEVYIEKYQDVKATQPIISFVDIDQLKIETYVTQDIAFQAQKGEKVKLQFDVMTGKTYEASILEISKSTTPNNLSYLLTARLSNQGGQLLSGMSGKLLLDLADLSTPSSVAIIPQIALCHRPTEGDYVWVVTPETQQVSKRTIIPGQLLPNGNVSVIQGLKVNEYIAISGLRFLSEGMSVKIYSEK